MFIDYKFNLWANAFRCINVLKRLMATILQSRKKIISDCNHCSYSFIYIQKNWKAEFGSCYNFSHSVIVFLEYWRSIYFENLIFPCQNKQKLAETLETLIPIKLMVTPRTTSCQATKAKHQVHGDACNTNCKKYCHRYYEFFIGPFHRRWFIVGLFSLCKSFF